MGFDTLMRNITRTGGVAPARAYVGELLPDVPAGIQPGKVFDRTSTVDAVPDGYRAVADREGADRPVTRGPSPPMCGGTSGS